MKRCIHLDWLELYCLEDNIGYPHNADYFRRAGWSVQEREYGTPVYHEMFTLVDHRSEKVIEIRRNPKSQRGVNDNGVLDPNACHVRLTNRSCYFSNPAQFLQDFIEQYGLHYQRISRIDLALDFELFDSRDEPQKFLQRYMAGHYAKINQANISCHGKDMWDGRNWNSVSWGKQKSMIGTKLYNKTMELTEVKDKPYIRQAWKECGLVEDEVALTKHDGKGKVYQPQIWRLEFSIKSGTRNWFVMEDYNGQKRQLRSIRNDLSCYKTEQQWLDIFWSLCDHYFHFKRVERMADGSLQRKDRCTDKVLWNPKKRNCFYKIENIAGATPKRNILDKLLHLLLDYQQNHVQSDIYNACEVLIKQVAYEQRRDSLTLPWPADEITALRQLLARRLNHDQPMSTTLEELRSFIRIHKDLWLEHDKPAK